MNAAVEPLCRSGDGRVVHALGRCKSCYERAQRSAGTFSGPLRVAAVPAWPANWTERALCAQADAEAWYPPQGGSTERVKAICGRCPVARECLDLVMSLPAGTEGIWAGTTPGDRREMRRKQAAA